MFIQVGLATWSLRFLCVASVTHFLIVEGVILDYSKSELMLLKYADGHNKNNSFPGYFTYNHQLDVVAVINKSLEDGLLETASTEFVLNKSAVSQLKEFAAQYGIKYKSPKSAFIEIILNNVDEQEIRKAFSDEYYVLSAAGQALVAEQLTDDDFENRYSPVLKGFDEALLLVKKKKYAQAEQILTANGHAPAINHTSYKSYDLFFKHKVRLPLVPLDDATLKSYMLLYYLYGTRAETASKDFKTRTNLELPISVIHKCFKIIRAIDDLIVAKETAKKFKGSDLVYTYTIRSCKDERVCSACSDMEGKSFNSLDAAIGYNYPPFDKCNCEVCRCFASFDIGTKA
ncbi:MAG: hypothetical protein IJE51_00435 [Clostridia bacterium]|nr:hypothetical protein [Clostridia bacterium]